MKYFFFLLTIVLADNLCFSQSHEENVICLTRDISGRIPMKKIEKLHGLVLDYYRKNPERFPQYDTIQFVDAYVVYMNSSFSWDYGMIENGDFLDHISLFSCTPNKHMRKRLGLKRGAKEWQSASVIIYNSQNIPILNLQMGEISPANDDGIESILLQRISEYRITSLYNLKGTTVQCWIGVNKEREVFVFKLEYGNKKITVFPAKDFQDEEFPYLFPKQDDWGSSIVWDYRMKQN